jgi:radical SAM protein with 4Fe4S-binding SPASM domain
MVRLIEIQPVPGSGKLVRAEPFGGTIAFRKPEMVVTVDHDFLSSMGRRTDAGRARAADSKQLLDPVAPFEAHLTVAHGCRAGCRGCYIDSDDRDPGEVDLELWRGALAILAKQGVYHVALGAGESTPLESLIALAHTARELGLTPNLSTSGRRLTPRLARKLDVFGRVHLSLDGAADAAGSVRDRDDFSASLMALDILRAFHDRVGVNCVVARTNYDKLESLFRLLDGRGVRNVELLRFKPAGRGARIFNEIRMTAEQGQSFMGHVLRLGRRYRLRLRLDCSFTPMVCAAGISPARLSGMGLAGCVGGSWLVSVDWLGRLSGCSFDYENGRASIQDLGRPGLFDHYLNWTKRAPEPCASCDYLSVCRGGCHVVARHVSGSFFAADPGCPLVRKWEQGG